MPLSVLPEQLDSLGLNHAAILVSFLAESLRAHASTGSLLSLASVPLLKESLCGPHTAPLSPGPVLCALHHPNKHKVFLASASDSFRK